MKDQKTFDEMAIYLLNQKNCRVNGKGFAVLDMHKFVNLAIERVELIPTEKRKKNIMCKTTKGAMQRVYKSFLDKTIEPTNTRHGKNFASIYGV